MAAISPRVLIKSGYILYPLSPYRIQVNVADQFQKIVVFITDYGLVAILEKMAVWVVPTIVFAPS